MNTGNLQYFSLYPCWQVTPEQDHSCILCNHGLLSSFPLMLDSEKLRLSPKNYEEIRQVKLLLVSSDVEASRSSDALSLWDPALRHSSVAKVPDVTLIKKSTHKATGEYGGTKTMHRIQSLQSCNPRHLSSHLHIIPSDVSLCIWTQSRSSNDMC